MRHTRARGAEWRGEAPVGLPGWSGAERDHLADELSDVLLYLLRLADVCAIDLPSAAARKIERNGEKYPADRCAGSAEKYTAYLPPADASSDPSASALMPLREAIDEASGSEGGGRPPAKAPMLTATVIAPELAAEALAAAGQSNPPVLATLVKKRGAADDGGSNKKPRGRPPKGRNGRSKRWVADVGYVSDHSID